MTPLPSGFLRRPFAHRGLHGPGRPENSLAAVRAAVAGGWGIEIDVRAAADGVPVVFHDAQLRRLTGAPGPLAARPASELGHLRLQGTDATIPTLASTLAAVAGRVPLLVEMKSGDDLGPATGPLAARVATLLAAYEGPAAAMSFNPHLVAAVAAAAPGCPRGLVTCAFGTDWPIPEARRAALAAVADADRTGVAFVSHDHRDLGRPRLRALRAEGRALLAWTIRTPAQATAARRHVDQITFEGFTPA